MYPSGASFSINLYLPSGKSLIVILPSESVRPLNINLSSSVYTSIKALGTGLAVDKSVLDISTSPLPI